MTIAALLGHFGINVPRYVTMDGQIVFDGVTASAGGGFTSTTHGAVTPVTTTPSTVARNPTTRPRTPRSPARGGTTPQPSTVTSQQ